MKNLILWFVPERYKIDDELFRKSRFIVWFVWITVGITIPICIYTFTIRPDDAGNIVVGILVPIVFFTALLIFRRTGSFIVLTHIICGFFTLAMAGAPSMSGGILSPDMPTIYIVPIFALIMGNTRTAIFYATAMMILFIWYYLDYFESTGMYRNHIENLPPEYFLMNIVFNAFIILFLVFRNENIRLKIWAQLKKTNLVISEKSKEITDSINYAKRIQSAILPQKSTLQRVLPNSFFYYQPKDIVSGDFYWIHEEKESCFLVVGDCTGHGVPGAFMSVVGVNQLNNIVLLKGVGEPSEILTALNYGVIDSLQQRHTETNDGMDLALLKIHKSENKIEFSGANRPIYLIRDGNLIQHKPSKFPIGGFNTGRDKKFETTAISVQQGDMIYLSTDGYADQFGSDKDKKITTKKFKKMLVSIADKPLEEQEKFLRDFHVNWKKDIDQTDDILVVGIKF